MDNRVWRDMLSDEHFSSSDSCKMPESKILPFLRTKRPMIQIDSDDEQNFDGENFSAFDFEDRCNYDQKNRER